MTKTTRPSPYPVAQPDPAPDEIAVSFSGAMGVGKTLMSRYIETELRSMGYQVRRDERHLNDTERDTIYVVMTPSNRIKLANKIG